MTGALIAKIIAFTMYLGLMIYVGLRNASKNTNSSDFFLGGRKVGPWVTALSAEASDSSAWLLMGLPGLCYLGGVKETIWTALGLIVGTYLNWLFVAKPLRKCSSSFGDSITIPEFLENRLKDKTHVLSMICVFFIVFFFTIYTASGFVACAKLFRSVFGLDYNIGLLIGFVVILTYTIAGGYTAVCKTDFIQGALIFVAFVLSSIVIVIALGGFGNAIKSVQSFDAKALAGELGDSIKTTFGNNQSFGFMSVISAVAWGLGYFGMPHIIIRFMGIRSTDDVAMARRVGIGWMIISYIGTFIIGTLGTAYLLKHGILLGSDGTNLSAEIAGVVSQFGDAETVFSETMQQMYPAFIAGIFLCAILAASMSTADSQLLAASSAVSRDVYKGIINKNADEKKVLLIGRITVVVIAAIALLLAFDQNSSVFGLVSYAWAGFGATLGPLILLSLYWKGLTSAGAIAGIIGGGITVVAWHQIPAKVAPIFGLYEIIPGFVVCFVLAVIVSMCIKNKNEEMLKEFDDYKKA